MSFLYVSQETTPNHRIYLWGSQKVKTNETLPKYLATNSDGSVLCIAYHNTEQGVTIVDQDSDLTRNIAVPCCVQPSKIVISDTHVYIAEKGQVYKVNFNGEVISRFGTVDSIISCLAIDQQGGLVFIGNFNRLAHFQGVLVYTSNGNFSKVLCRDLRPVDMAFDQEADSIHICDSKTSSIKVYSKQGILEQSYGQHHLQNPTRIAIHPRNHCRVVLETISLSVFNKEGCYMYEINLDKNGILDFAIMGDGNLWLTDTYFNLIKQQSNVFFSPPPSLRLLCQSKILLNIAELPTSLLPTRYSSYFNGWSKTIQYQMKMNTNGSQVCKDGRLKIPPELNCQALAMILEDRVGISCTILSRHMEYDEKRNRVAINIV